MFPDHLAVMFTPRQQGAAQALVRTGAQGIAKCHGDIAQPALMADAADRVARQPVVEFAF